MFLPLLAETLALDPIGLIGFIGFVGLIGFIGFYRV